MLRRLEKVRPNLRNLGVESSAKDIFLSLVNPSESFESYDTMGGDVTDLRPTGYKLQNSKFVRFPWILLATSSLRNDEAVTPGSSVWFLRDRFWVDCFACMQEDSMVEFSTPRPKTRPELHRYDPMCANMC